ncbi:hypothetical protein BJP34_34070 [Moorena producens PAL-8-15-08-1]|uniref:Uncharacterized protein n=1 Tax=Moorena producens PAL-8-15-08-1 TaxID=1458985 RepID=A0A1D8U1Y3_9CYAN|nr:hypothetical protein [Moorena producens]AOX03794.1 hypothetical protein BJP34_34070 [Moorena producens PAL-8-15-08-1]
MLEIMSIHKADEINQLKKTKSGIITGKMELNIKINELPIAKTVKNGWQEFNVDCDGTMFTIKVKPKVWKKITTANEMYSMWVAVITGKLGAKINKGFRVEQPGIQVFEKKPKAPKPDKAQLQAQSQAQLQAQLAQSQAQLAQSQAQLQAQLQNQSHEQLDQSQEQLAQSQAQLAQSQEQLEQSQEQLKQSQEQLAQSQEQLQEQLAQSQAQLQAQA